MTAIKDEFSDLPVSRQRKYELRRRRDRRCVICGQETVGGLFCLKHLVEKRERARKSRGSKKRLPEARSYSLEREMKSARRLNIESTQRGIKERLTSRFRRRSGLVVKPQLYTSRSVSHLTMSKFIALLLVTVCAVASTAVAATYSTEATMTRQKDKGTYEVVVRVTQLVERHGTVTEELIEQPRIISSPGVPARLHCGLQPSDRDYTKRENVSVDVSWPEAGQRGFAVCTVVVKLGNKMVSKTKMQVTMEEK